MTKPSHDARIQAAMAYDEIFVPALFGAWTERLAQWAGLAPGDRVLDVACGTGGFVREAIHHVQPGGHVTGLDADPGMLAVAGQHNPRASWTLGTAEQLPYPDASFDVVVCAFGLMFFNDRLGALRQMHRVLAPGGRLVLAVWGPLERCVGYAMAAALFDRIAGRQAADVVREPFALGDPAEMESLLLAAEFTAPRLLEESGQATFASIEAMVNADVRGWLPLRGITLDMEVVGRLHQEADRSLATFRGQDGSVTFECPALIVTAAKQSPSDTTP